MIPHVASRRRLQAVAALLCLPGMLHAVEPLVRNEYEEAAIAAGRKLGIGTAALEGPESAEVMSHQTWTLVYRAGRAGIAPGGGIRIGMRHLPQWSPPQTDDSKEPGYLTVRAPRGVPVETYIEFGNFRARFFKPYFAWQNMVEVTLPEKGLSPGETIRVTFGDRGGGSPGMRVQPFDESAFVFKVYVDAPGEGDYLPMGDCPAVEIVAAEPDRLAVVMPSDAVAGEPTWCLVRAEDRYGNPATRYRGTIAWRSSDPSAGLPGDYGFVEADRGVRRFENVTFRSPGAQTIAVADGRFEATGNPVRVAAGRPDRLLLWGDLHGHTLHSDGRGTVEEYYDFAQRFSGLDFAAVSDHAFQLVDAMWEDSKRITNRFNQPGRFVTFNAFEWSGTSDVGGDHNVYFLDDDPPLFRSTSYYDAANLQMDHGPEPKLAHITDVFAAIEDLAKAKRAFCVPHWGGRPGNPEWHHPEAERLIEIFSEHRRSEPWVNTFLDRGYRLGIMASTDGHYGNPGHGYLRPTFDWDTQEIGMAAVAVYAPERTREAIFRALYDRRVYATSGERIVLDFRCDGHAMGSEYRTDAPPTIEVEAVGTAPIARLEIQRDGRTVHQIEPGSAGVSLRWRDADFRADGTHYYYVRVIQKDNEEAISSPIWLN
jgi:hypothetical protein